MQRGHQRGAAAGRGRHDQLQDLIGQLRVQVAHRLVGQQQARRLGDHARDADALLLAAAQAVGAAVRLAGQLHLFQRRERRLAVALGEDAEQAGRPQVTQAAAQHVLQDRGAADQVEALEDEAHLPSSRARHARGRVHVPIQHAHPPGVRPDAGVEHAQERRLAGAARPQHGHALAFDDTQVLDVHHRRHRAGEKHVCVVDLDGRTRHGDRLGISHRSNPYRLAIRSTPSYAACSTAM